MMSTRCSALRTVPVMSRSLRSFTSQDSTPAPEPIQKEVKEVRIPVPWGHIAGKWWGPHDVKPVIALHGWQDNANTWDGVAPLINSNIGLLCLDLAGHGWSSPYPLGAPDHQLEYLVLLRRIICHYGWKRVTLLGHSMGSIISFVYSCIYPDEVNNYIAIEGFAPNPRTPNTLFDHWEKTITSLMDALSWNLETAPSYTYAKILEQMCQAHNNSLTIESAKILLERGTLKRSDGTFSYIRDPRVKYMLLFGCQQELIIQLACNIRTNVLLISGSSGMKSEYPEHYENLLHTVKKFANKFEHHVVEGTHHVHLNNPEKVAPLINDFLSQAVI